MSDGAEDPQRTDAFAVNLLALASIRGLGVKALRALFTAFHQLEDVWSADTGELQRTLARAQIPNSDRIAAQIRESQEQLLGQGKRSLELLQSADVRLLARWESQFPKRLKKLPDAPFWLFVQGDPAILNGPPLVAIVGTRESSELGIRTAERLAYLTVMEGLSIVSGLAEGIDAAAHRVASLYSVPQVAILGTGINLVFPMATARLRSRILEDGGAIVTEYLPEDRYGRSNFVQRNRIQAGLASALCAVEGRLRSGTMHTIRFAEKYERPIFAVRRGADAAENEILSLLTMRGLPSFDLATDTGIAGLREFLRQIPGPRLPAPKKVATDIVFADVLRVFDELLKEVQLSPAEVRWLLKELTNRAGLGDQGAEPNGGG